ncbi:MAG: hypothetical protein VX004_07225, partial [SAR324 cluster bacterium]|nr:hypothetical protein [SAR324 cluster bacterium]
TIDSRFARAVIAGIADATRRSCNSSRTNRNLDPASDQQSVAWAVAVSIKQTLDSSVPKMGRCRTLGGFELGHPVAY